MKVYKLIARLQNNSVRLEKIILSEKPLDVDKRYIRDESLPLSIYQNLACILHDDYSWFMENYISFHYEEVDYAILSTPTHDDEVTNSNICTPATIVDVRELRLPDDLYDELATYLEVSNGATYKWRIDTPYFKKADELKAILKAHNVPMDGLIYLSFSW